MRSIRAIASTAFCAAALAGCEPQEAARAPCPQGWNCLEYGNLSEPGTLDPHLTSGTWEQRIVGDLMIGLTQNDPNGRPIPGMATSWESSADGLTWTFHLREARWSDGVPVSAHDFVFALRRAIDPGTGAENAILLYFLKNAREISAGRAAVDSLGVRALDDRTLELRLEHPVPYLEEVAKHAITMPVPAHVVRKRGDAWTRPGYYVSNGPYLLKAWKLGDHVQVVRNPDFDDGGAPLCIDRINYYPTTDGVSAERRIRNGELDVNTDFQSNRLQHIQQTMPGYAHAAPYVSTVYLSFNTRLPVLKDKRVRQALAMAVDNEFITRKLLRAGQRAAYAFIPPETANHLPAARLRWADWPYERRLAEARRLLAEAGYGPERPLRLEIKHRNQPDAMLFMPAVQADWRQIGVHVELVQNETQIAYAAYRARDFMVADAAYSAEFNDPRSFLALHHSTGGPQNFAGYDSGEFDRLLGLADAETDLAARAKHLAAAEQVLLEDLPIAPVYFSISRNLVNPRITGWVDNIVNWHRARYLCAQELR